MPPPQDQPQRKRLYTLHPARTPQDLSDIKTLFTAYTTWLNIDLSFQDFASELQLLPGKYSPPFGELLLARNDDTGEAIGCAGLRPLSITLAEKNVEGNVGGGDRRYCELKRLYITPAARGMGVAKALLTRVLQTARELGYDEIRLDTLPHMTDAVSLYRNFGFSECGKYYETPLEETVFFGRSL